MRVFWLYIGAAVVLAIPMISAEAAETAAVDNRVIASTDDLGFGPMSAVRGSYKSGAHSVTDDVTTSSTTRILQGRYEFDHRSWQLKPHIGASWGTAGINEKPLGYSSADWTVYRRGGATLGLPQKPVASLDNGSMMGWTNQLGLAPPITSTIGIPYDMPSDIRQRGFMFGADYHF